MPRNERQNELLGYYQFKCECKACVQNYPIFIKLPKHDVDFAEPNMEFFGTVKESLAELKQNFAYMEQQKTKQYPSYEITYLMHRNSCLFMHLAGKAYCSFYEV